MKHTYYRDRVLIESDWNLKDISPDSSPRLHGVLIESDWNLRII